MVHYTVIKFLEHSCMDFELPEKLIILFSLDITYDTILETMQWEITGLLSD